MKKLSLALCFVVTLSTAGCGLKGNLSMGGGGMGVGGGSGSAVDQMTEAQCRGTPISTDVRTTWRLKQVSGNITNNLGLVISTNSTTLTTTCQRAGYPSTFATVTVDSSISGQMLNLAESDFQDNSIPGVKCQSQLNKGSAHFELVGPCLHINLGGASHFFSRSSF